MVTGKKPNLTQQYARRLRETGDNAESAAQKARELIDLLSSVRKAVVFTEARGSHDHMVREVMENPDTYDHLSRDGDYNRTGKFFERGLISPELKKRILEIQPIWRRINPTVQNREWKTKILMDRRTQKRELRLDVAEAAAALRQLKNKQRARTQRIRTRARARSGR